MADQPDTPAGAGIDPADETHEQPAVEPAPDAPTPGSGGLMLRYAALSDVGRVRKDNQDSGYAGPWLLAICDGVGGAVRGDIASSEVIIWIRRLDRPPGSGANGTNGTTPVDDDPLARVGGALQRAHDRIADIVDQDPSLNGTSTTATVGLFTGSRLAVGHLGDSRAYRLRGRELTQLTKDHTFVQTLIDDGRITEVEARTHPHRNLILKALDGSSHAEPDLFYVDLEAGDRLLLCSDGVLSLTDVRVADIMGTGTPDHVVVELIRAALDAGSNDNITCVVADVVDAGLVAGAENGSTTDQPLLVGAAADLPRRRTSGSLAGMFRGHRTGDTGEIEPVQAELPEGVDFAIDSDPPIDPETFRYAPRPPERFVWLRRLFVLMVVVGLVWMAGAAAWAWSQRQFYVNDDQGVVTIYRGLNAEVPGVELSHPFEASNVELERLSDYDAGQVREGIDADSLSDARQTVANLADRQDAP